MNIVDCVLDGLKTSQNINDNLWECMFEFLEEVTFISRKKLTFKQVYEFWKIKDARQYFLKFLKKYRLKKEDDKSQQKIIYKQITPDLIRELNEKIFMDNKEMDFQNISLELYQTVD